MKTAHIVSHSHWDREWYLPFERHHMLLVELFDALLETLAKDPAFRSFHLDGQTIVVDDYLAVRPERRAEVERFIAEGRLVVGPWYILQDEWLTSSEANLRNLQYGIASAQAYGKVCLVGYFPDSFGNMGQAPQILSQAGMKAAFFGRGVKPTGFNNQVADGEFESPYSEMWWESPDGSRVLGVLFANWYSNGIEVPTRSEDAQAYWAKRLADAARYASTDQLLFLNGCDHQPVQTDLSRALEVSAQAVPDVRFVHSSFPEYLEALGPRLPEPLAVIRGELRSQHTDGWYTLANTASSRIRLKQTNARVQTLFEAVAEPLAAWASLRGAPYPHDQLRYGWKTLMQNHPHDSICGCSVDEVHREMAARFKKAEAVAGHVIDESLRVLSQADTDSFATWEWSRPFVVFNTTAHPRTALVDVELVVFRQDFGGDYKAAVAAAREFSPGRYQVVDEAGRVVGAQIEVLEASFGYDLPKDRFRVPYMARKARVRISVKDLEGLSTRRFALVPARDVADQPPAQPVLRSERVLENPWLRAELRDDGTVRLTDKATGRVWTDLCRLDDVGDIGNEYIFRQAGAPIVSGSQVTILPGTSSPVEGCLEAVVTLDLPVSADERLSREVADLVEFRDRQAGRSTQTKSVAFVVRYRLGIDDRHLTIELEFDNQVKDHRVRALIPTDLSVPFHQAESVFEAPVRQNHPAPVWENPCRAQHQQSFVNLHEPAWGMTVANQGLPEYEILEDGRNTIALTLVRSVGELGDWGVFPTPEAQEQGPIRVRFALVPHGAEGDLHRSMVEARLFSIPVPSVPLASARASTQAPWNPRADEGLVFSSLKGTGEAGVLAYRWFNVTERPLALSWDGSPEVFHSDVLESKGPRVNGNRVEVGPGKIVTFLVGVSRSNQNDHRP